MFVRSQALRAVGGFDEGASHFDDWSAWLRVADRHARIWRVNEVVPCLSPENTRHVAMAREIVLATDVTTYDDYVNAVLGSLSLKTLCRRVKFRA